MTRAYDWLAWLAARMGWPGLTGVGLLIAAVLMRALLLPELRHDIEALEAEVARVQQLRARPVEAPMASDALGRLGDPHDTPGAVGRLFRAAARAGLELEQGEYRLQQAGGGLWRYQIVLPVVGSYPALRTFLADALNANPGLALDGLYLGRERVESAELRAVMRFTLYLDMEGGP